MTAVGCCKNDPLRFVKGIYRWEEIENSQGPDKWQINALNKIKKAMDTKGKIKIAVASGHGIGKGALAAWIIHWFLSTHTRGKGVVTANTQIQLRSKTWAELGLWLRRSKNAHWFKFSKTRLEYKDEDASSYFVEAVPHSENKPESFAGTHADETLMIFDEASSIPALIWDTAESSFTSKRAVFLVLGNPLNRNGRFYEIFNGKQSKDWVKMNVASTDCKIPDQTLFEQWKEVWGENSDFYRSRVLGLFPQSSNKQFIETRVVDTALKKSELEQVYDYPRSPIVMGVDVALMGDDRTVLIVRHGGKILQICTYSQQDSNATQGRIAELYLDYKNANNPFAKIYIDKIGVGAGIYDHLKSQLGDDLIKGINAGEKSTDPEINQNLKTDMWVRMRDWLLNSSLPIGSNDILDKNGKPLIMPDDAHQLKQDLITPEIMYSHNMKLRIEPKDTIRKRGLPSTDYGDALALTFADPIILKDTVNHAYTFAGKSSSLDFLRK